MNKKPHSTSADDDSMTDDRTIRPQDRTKKRTSLDSMTDDRNVCPDEFVEPRPGAEDEGKCPITRIIGRIHKIAQVVVSDSDAGGCHTVHVITLIKRGADYFCSAVFVEKVVDPSVVSRVARILSFVDAGQEVQLTILHEGEVSARRSAPDLDNVIFFTDIEFDPLAFKRDACFVS